MISQSKIKLVRSLAQKKYRDQYRMFLVEGEKMVGEILSTAPGGRYRLLEIIATGSWIEQHGHPDLKKEMEVTEAGEKQIAQMSNLVSPQPVLALIAMPEAEPEAASGADDLILGFESVRDPGNLGTVIRTADWFGVKHIYCSEDSVDLFNPKVVQSTMGAIFRVNVHYSELGSLIDIEFLNSRKIFGTFLNGESLYETDPGQAPFVLFGNESRGLSQALASRVHKRISIPSYTKETGQGSESLNLAASAAIVCSEFRRRMNQ
jgi:TrmH family RNA methyltransferase